MNLTQHSAKHLRDVHFGGNWTSVNLKDTLAGVIIKHTHYHLEQIVTIKNTPAGN